MRYWSCVLVLLLISCSDKDSNSKSEVVSEKIESIKISSDDSLRIDSYFKKAWHSMPSSKKFQSYLDSALVIVPDSAYFWEQKAMTLYKARKYSLGKPFLKKAVAHNPKKYLEYSGFMKCIFSKEYEESIEELLDAKERFGDSYVMDHTYNFYIGLDYLQLNEFEKAKEFLLKSKAQQFADFPNDSPEEACHYLDWFYLGVVDYELENYDEAIANFDMSLKVYENFGDALYYKAISLRDTDQLEKAKEIYQLAFANNQNTINEDNAFYEVYPYQVFHKLSPMSSVEK